MKKQKQHNIDIFHNFNLMLKNENMWLMESEIYPQERYKLGKINIPLIYPLQRHKNKNKNKIRYSLYDTWAVSRDKYIKYYMYEMKVTHNKNMNFIIHIYFLDSLSLHKSYAKLLNIVSFYFRCICCLNTFRCLNKLKHFIVQGRPNKSKYLIYLCKFRLTASATNWHSIRHAKCGWMGQSMR